eukprot:gene30-321_t
MAENQTVMGAVETLSGTVVWCFTLKKDPSLGFLRPGWTELERGGDNRVVKSPHDVAFRLVDTDGPLYPGAKVKYTLHTNAAGRVTAKNVVGSPVSWGDEKIEGFVSQWDVEKPWAFCTDRNGTGFYSRQCEYDMFAQTPPEANQRVRFIPAMVDGKTRAFRVEAVGGANAPRQASFQTPNRLKSPGFAIAISDGGAGKRMAELEEKLTQKLEARIDEKMKKLTDDVGALQLAAKEHSGAKAILLAISARLNVSDAEIAKYADKPALEDQKQGAIEDEKKPGQDPADRMEVDDDVDSDKKKKKMKKRAKSDSDLSQAATDVQASKKPKKDDDDDAPLSPGKKEKKKNQILFHADPKNQQNANLQEALKNNNVNVNQIKDAANKIKEQASAAKLASGCK